MIKKKCVIYEWKCHSKTQYVCHADKLNFKKRWGACENEELSIHLHIADLLGHKVYQGKH